MKERKVLHSFHIPVMGTGFTIDTPLKVAPYGISSVISLVDDILMEKMREFYSNKLDLPFQEITNKIDDFRAKRITAFLNLVDGMVKDKFDELKNSVHDKSNEVDKYIDMLPDFSEIKGKFNQLLQSNNVEEARQWVKDHLSPGEIDVNIMTKLDKENYKGKEKLPSEYNDAHAALRGFANSQLKSSVILSAGMNPRLYSYFENFEDFYPNQEGALNKKIILKVSDYRSALIQGKFLAKKGLWISEFRIESGLNCGGHAFATDGYLMGPILEEFRNNKESLVETTFEIYKNALIAKDRISPENAPEVKITAQGGVGTAEEHSFLLDYYKLDGVGWGTPFLLVPEVTNVDTETKKLLLGAKEEDLYLSGISPLGVPFNSLRGNTKDEDKLAKIAKGRPGSNCPKKYLVSNTEFTDQAICSASKQYQFKKIKELDAKDLSPEDHKKTYDKIVDKSCICVGLGTTAMLNNDLDTKVEGPGVSICPGPNMAYFSELVSLKKMVDHIYGRTNIMHRTDRPNMFIKELKMYVNYFKNKIDEVSIPPSKKELRYLDIFRKNLNEGIGYYKELFAKQYKASAIATLLSDLKKLETELEMLDLQVEVS